jgi:hypothetical protein
LGKRAPQSFTPPLSVVGVSNKEEVAHYHFDVDLVDKETMSTLKEEVRTMCSYTEDEVVEK